MADLERHAFKRDKGFLVKLVLFVLVGAAFGIFVYIKITSPDVGGCLAGGFGDVTEGEQGGEGGEDAAGE